MKVSHSTVGASWLLQMTVVCGHGRIPILNFYLRLKGFVQPYAHDPAQAPGLSVQPI